MIDLYLTDISDLELSSGYLARLTSDRLEKLKRLRLEEDKKRCLGAGLLLDDYVIKGNKNSYKVSDSGKPYMENGIFFNLSHSGKYALLAVSDAEIGCDIEKCREKDFMKLSKFVFHQNEIEAIKNSDDAENYFFSLWTKKEAFLKATGEGFRRKSTDIDLSGSSYTEGNKTYYFRHYDLDEYKICLCSSDNVFPDTCKTVKY